MLRRVSRTDAREARDKRWIALILICSAQFAVVLDASIVNVALPTIGRALEFTESSLPWVANAYVLTFGGFLLLGGRLADLLGRRRVLHVRRRPLRPRLVLTEGFQTAFLVGAGFAILGLLATPLLIRTADSRAHVELGREPATESSPG